MHKLQAKYPSTYGAVLDKKNEGLAVSYCYNDL